MGQSFFIWKNKDCRSMGVKLSGPAAIIRPEERVQHIEIPGRSGDLTQLQGENIYNSYIQTVTILVHGGYRARDVFDWLRGSGFVTFSGEPDKKQAARIIGAVTLDRHSYNLDWWSGEVQFYCQPLKEKLNDSSVTIASSGSSVRNSGDVEAKPLWKLTANDTSATVASGGKSLAVTGLTSGNVYYIDSDVMEVYNADRSAILTGNSIGDFPVLAIGNNSVTGSGWSSLEISRRERFL
jgi:phage-related protein